MSTVEEQFHAAMLQIYEDAKAETGYNATRFLQMVYEQGGLQAAKNLLRPGPPPEGFTQLALCERLDLTMEHLVLQPEFTRLFEYDELLVARERLGRD